MPAVPTKAPYSLSTADAAHLLGCSPSQVVNLIRAGQLRALDVSVSGTVPTFRLSRADVDAFISRRVSP